MIMMLSMMDDEERSKFIVLYELYGAGLKYFIKGILHDDFKSEDALQRCYETIMRNLGKIGDVKSAETKSYVFAIARTTALHVIREEKRYAAVLNESGDDDENRHVWQVADQGVNVENEVVGSEEHKVFAERAIEHLTREERMILGYRVNHAMSFEQIAEVFGVSEAACRKRLERVRKKLKKLHRGDE